MRRWIDGVSTLRCCGAVLLVCSGIAMARVQQFQHIVIIVQENRSPDNLFQGLCAPPYGSTASCSTKPTATQYNISTRNWLDSQSSTHYTQPTAVPLNADFDPTHSHNAFVQMCDLNATTGVCRMDGAALINCTDDCPAKPSFTYVDYTTGDVDPYLMLATQYGWANYMFQSNQGPSFPAHQFLFGATSAPSADDDAVGTFAAENMNGPVTNAGCIADNDVSVQLIDANGVESGQNKIFPCFDHDTLVDLFKANNITWRYYTPSAGSIWTAPNAISHICQADGSKCTGPDWVSNVDLFPAHVLTDIGNCNLRQVSWVIPTGANSDHPDKPNGGGGPSWVTSIVNAVGNSGCTNPDGSTYWNSTAIIILWDDWGGFYDHVPPTILPYPWGAYEYGFRVPMIFVSAYTLPGYIDNMRYDFGSLVRLLERNFGLAEGALNFGDARAKRDLATFFDFRRTPRVFVPIPAKLGANYFLHDKTPVSDPDDD